MKTLAGFIKEKKFILGLSLAAVFVAFLPLFTTNCVLGHDVDYHLLRIEALKTGIMAGKPFLKVNMLYFGGRGYASSLFYPDFLLYIPALLRVVGVGINASYHCFIAIMLLLSFWTMYFSVSNVLRSEKCENDNAAAAAAICYLLAQYHLNDIYVRAAVGEYTAMIFLPLLLYGLYDLIRGGLKHVHIMIVGFSGVLLCHTISTVLAIGVYVTGLILAIWYIAFVKKDKPLMGSVLKRLLGAAASAAGITCFYYLPVLEQFMAARFQTGAGKFDLDYEKLLLKDVFEGINPGFGLLLPVLLFAVFMAVRGIARVEKSDSLIFPDFCSLLSVLFILASTGIVPWKRLQNLLGFIQFPWRLFVIALPLMCMAIGVYIGFLFKGRKEEVCRYAVLFITCMAIFSACYAMEKADIEYYSYSNDYYSYIPYTGSVIGGEWLPEAVADRDLLLKDTDVAITGTGERLTVERDKNTLCIKALGNEEYIDVPFIFYKGYAATAEDGAYLAVDGDGENGSVRVYTKGYSGDIRVYYAGTFIQKLSAVISLLSLIILIYICVNNKLRRDSQRLAGIKK